MIYENSFTQANQDSTISFTWENSKMFNITSKYFRIFNNNQPESWVTNKCYFCSYWGKLFYLIQCENLLKENRGCFWPFSYVYTINWFLLHYIVTYKRLPMFENVIHQIDINDCLVLSVFQQGLQQYLS